MSVVKNQTKPADVMFIKVRASPFSKVSRRWRVDTFYKCILGGGGHHTEN